jgi:hypothetical protein
MGIERDLTARTPREDVGLAELGFGVGEDLPGGQRPEVGLLGGRAALGSGDCGVAGAVARGQPRTLVT